MTDTTNQDSRPQDERETRGRSRSPGRASRTSRSPDRRPRSRLSPTRETHRSSHRSRSPRRRRDHSGSRSRSRSPRRHRDRSRDKRRRSRSRSVSSHSSDSDSSRDRRRRRKRHDKEERRKEKKERKREKRDRKDKKKHKGKTGAVTGQWGQHGIINESHMYEKDAEFRTWLVEECKVNPESLSKDATRRQFAQFIEDYNTATLPHPKFYNMESYERQMNSLRNGMTADVTANTYDLNADMAAHTSRHKRPTTEAETYLSREQLQELRKVQNERNQAGQMKRLGMEIKGTMGVRMDGSEFE
ncbi:hypothetical protein B0J17DRAFT_678552 [Rhizoctonia solani]|nr:hypothetical protein B0J17DRAFT_678552 [Rhizoctonia solani]